MAPGRLERFDRPFRRQGLLAGVDEAGRGPLAGPVVAAAVILHEGLCLPRLNDSKQLSESARRTLFAWIQRHALSIGLGVVSAEEIDRINIRQASFQAMRLALANLSFPPQHVLVDGFRIPHLAWPQTAIIRGDAQSASIAAASIVAKVTRDALMLWVDRCYPGYGFDRHKGYPTAFHRKRLKAMGPCPLHRRSFAPVRAVEAAA